MSSELREEWEKELRVLLDRVQHQPSADHTQARERIAVLQQLMRTSEPQPT